MSESQKITTESVFQELISDLRSSVRILRVNVLLTISIICMVGFLYAVYKNLFLAFNLGDMVISTYMSVNFIITFLFCIYYKMKRENFNEKVFKIFCYIFLIPFLLLYYALPFLSPNSISGLDNFHVTLLPILSISLCLGYKAARITIGFYILLIFFYLFSNFKLSFVTDNSYEYVISAPVPFFISLSVIWFSAGFLIIVFTSRTIQKMKSNIPLSIQKIEDIEEQNRKDQEETQRLTAEVEAITNLQKTLYFSAYKEESLEKFSLEVHFSIENSQNKKINSTPYYDCVYFEDQYLYCMGKGTENDIYSMASVLMIQTSLNNSFVKSLEEKVDIIEILDRVNSVLFFNNQYRMQLGSFSTFSLAHYDMKEEQIHLLSLSQEIIYIPNHSEEKDWIRCKFPVEMERYKLGVFGSIPEIQKFCFYTFPFSKGDSIFICDSFLDENIDYFQNILSKEKNLLEENHNSEKVVNSLLKKKAFEQSLISYIKKV